MLRFDCVFSCSWCWLGGFGFVVCWCGFSCLLAVIVSFCLWFVVTRLVCFGLLVGFRLQDVLLIVGVAFWFCWFACWVWLFCF